MASGIITITQSGAMFDFICDSNGNTICDSSGSNIYST